MNTKCPKCNKKLEKIEVEIENAHHKVTSYQCNCGYVKFDKKSVSEFMQKTRNKRTPV